VLEMRKIKIIILLLLIYLKPLNAQFQIGFDFGPSFLYDKFTYSTSLIDGPYKNEDDQFFRIGYLFDKNTFSSNSNYNISLNLKYNLNRAIFRPFMNISYFRINTSGSCMILPVHSGGLMYITRNFNINSNSFLMKAGIDFIPYRWRIKPVLTTGLIYNLMYFNNINFDNVSESFLKYAEVYNFKYSNDFINNIGFSFGAGIEFSASNCIILFLSYEYNNLNRFYNNLEKPLVVIMVKSGILYTL
jgi:hypothetical protein